MTFICDTHTFYRESTCITFGDIDSHGTYFCRNCCIYSSPTDSNSFTYRKAAQSGDIITLSGGSFSGFFYLLKHIKHQLMLVQRYRFHIC